MARSYDIFKQVVWQAHQRIKANKGVAGIDDQTTEDFEHDLKGNMYNIWNRRTSGSYLPPAVMGMTICQRRARRGACLSAKVGRRTVVISEGYAALLGAQSLLGRNRIVARIGVEGIEAPAELPQCRIEHRADRADRAQRMVFRYARLGTERAGKRILLNIGPTHCVCRPPR